MNTIIQIAVVFLVAFLIIKFLIPLLTGTIAIIALVLVVIGAIIALMKIGGLWF